MAILYYDEKKLFQLNTENTTYVIGLSPEGYVGHVYYGPLLHGEPDLYPLRMDEPPFTPSVNKREKSSFLDRFPMEYPTAVGLRSPIRLIRFETTLVAKSADTKGIRYRNFSPMLPMTNLFAVSTIISATAWRLEMFRIFKSLVSQMQSPVMSAITIQLTTSVSLI